MKVSEFMIPASKVVSVNPEDTVRKVMDLMLEKNIGAVVVTPPQDNDDNNDDSSEQQIVPMPLGIITKSDILKAYHARVNIDEPCTAIMCGRHLEERPSNDLITCTPSCSRDRAARVLEQNHMHHLIVVDEKQASKFVGLISSWDITSECAKDDRAWPWIRNAKGHPVFPNKIEEERKKKAEQAEMVASASASTFPSTAAGSSGHISTIADHPHDEFTVYMDDLDLEGLQ